MSMEQTKRGAKRDRRVAKLPDDVVAVLASTLDAITVYEVDQRDGTGVANESARKGMLK